MVAGGNFVHLHGHSPWSLLDGAARLEEIIPQAIEWGMPALSVTDHGAMYGTAQAYRLAQSFSEKLGKPFKFIPGVEVYVAPRSRFDKEKDQGDDANWHLVLWALDNIGLSMLYQLVSSSEMYYKPRIDKILLAELIETYGQGHLAGSTACIGSEVGQLLLSQDYSAAKGAALGYQEILGKGNFFLELQDHGLQEQQIVNTGLVQISRENQLPLVASNDYHYFRPEHAYYHDVLLCIQTGKTVDDPNRMRMATDQAYFKSAEEMYRLFGDYPEALYNTLVIAERSNVEMDFDTIHLPEFDIPPGFKSADEYLEHLAREGAMRRYGELSDPVVRRLEYELGVISQMGYADYFLIVWDFVRFARSQNIAVGPGRGSSAGSLVAYSLEITNVDPLRYGLLFERFLNPERVTLPDIDIDFCYHRRNEVIRYVIDKYGPDRVAQIITFGTLKPRAAVRDVARALGVPLRKADRIAKSIPFDAKSLPDALEKSPELKSVFDTDEETKEVIEIADFMAGFPRHPSTHAAGVVIAPRPLREDIPLYKPEGQKVVTKYATQYPMGVLEDMNFLKMDFLALRNLSVIQGTLEWIEKLRGITLDIDEIDLSDPKVFQLFSQGQTAGVFQFESEGMRQMLRDFQPESLEHLTLLNAMYRPGPAQYIPTVIRRRHGQERVEWPHPDLQSILEETYGIMAYQEQIMAVAHRFAGMSLGEADLLRRAIGKKVARIIEEQRQRFIDGAVEQGYDAKLAADIYADIEKFANYGFPKSHSCAYALVAYQTAYLKVHYPSEYMATLLTSVMAKNKNIKLGEYLQECQEMGITVLPPDVNTSEKVFVPRSDGSIVFGLTAVKNVGESVVEAIVKERSKRIFSSLYDFCSRVSVGREVLISLIKVGAFDSLGAKRSQLLAIVDDALKLGNKASSHEDQISFFDVAATGFSELDTELPLPEIEELPVSVRLQDERELVGFYLSGHPLDQYQDLLANLDIVDSRSLSKQPDEAKVQVAGVITELRRITTKKGDEMAFATLEDRSGPIDLTIFPRTWQRYKDLLDSHEPLLVEGRNDSIIDEPAQTTDSGAAGETEEEETEEVFQARLIVNGIQLLKEAQPLSSNGKPAEPNTLELWIKVSGSDPEQLYTLREVLVNHRGEHPVYLVFKEQNVACIVDEKHWVDASVSQLPAAIEAVTGVGTVVVQSTKRP